MNAEKFVRAALECSIFFSPRSPGLTHEELEEAGRRVGLGIGDIDAATRGLTSRWGEKKYEVPAPSFGDVFNPQPKPDYRNPAAFDFVCQELRRARSAGAPQVDRDVLVERGGASGLQRSDVEVAISMYLLTEHLLLADDGAVRFAPGRADRILPSEQIASRGGRSADNFTISRPELAAAYPIVKDIIERRSDGRPVAAEALDAFGGALARLGYEPLRMWWVQLVAELRRLDPTMSPVATCVLSAALVEGALAFVVKHGQTLGAFGSPDFQRTPTSWKIEDLVKSAASGGAQAILDATTRHRADALVKTRQRIHAGRMLSEYPGGVPDMRPEEARDAKATADLVVRRILDWLEKYPPRS